MQYTCPLKRDWNIVRTSARHFLSLESNPLLTVSTLRLCVGLASQLKPWDKIITKSFSLYIQKGLRVPCTKAEIQYPPFRQPGPFPSAQRTTLHCPLFFFLEGRDRLQTDVASEGGPVIKMKTNCHMQNEKKCFSAVEKSSFEFNAGWHV